MGLCSCVPLSPWAASTFHNKEKRAGLATQRLCLQVSRSGFAFPLPQHGADCARRNRNMLPYCVSGGVRVRNSDTALGPGPWATDSSGHAVRLPFEGKRRSGWQRIGWLSGHEFERAPGDTEGREPGLLPSMQSERVRCGSPTEQQVIFFSSLRPLRALVIFFTAFRWFCFVLFFWEELERGRVCLWACLLGRRSRTFCPLPSLARASSPDLLSGTTSFSSHPQLDTDDQRCVIPFILGIISYPRKYSHHASRNYRSKIIPSLTLLEAQWLRLCLPMQGVHVWSLVEELRSHMPEP